jgi:hypothetical protein
MYNTRCGFLIKPARAADLLSCWIACCDGVCTADVVAYVRTYGMGLVLLVLA